MTERVICIDDAPGEGYHWEPGREIVKGEFYTIRGRVVNMQGADCVLLCEVGGGRYWLNGTERGYLASRFAPIRDTSIEIFRAIDRKAFDKAGVDA